MIGGGSIKSFVLDAATLLIRGDEIEVRLSFGEVSVSGAVVVVVVDTKEGVVVTEGDTVETELNVVLAVTVGVDVATDAVVNEVEVTCFNEDPKLRGERGGEDVGDEIIDIDFGESIPLQNETL